MGAGTGFLFQPIQELHILSIDVQLNPHGSLQKTF